MAKKKNDNPDQVDLTPFTWIDGKVGRKWAKKHHSEWYKEIAAQEKPAEESEQ